MLSVSSISWELLPAKQQALLLPLIDYTVNTEAQCADDFTEPLPETTFKDLWEAWNDLDRLSLSSWLSEGSLIEVTGALEFLAEQTPDTKIKEIADAFSA